MGMCVADNLIGGTYMIEAVFTQEFGGGVRYTAGGEVEWRQNRR